MAGRIVVLISGSGSNMAALVGACRSGEVPGEVVAVGADRVCRGLVRAALEGVSTFVVRYDDHPSREQWSETLRARAAAYAPDLVVCAGLMRILAPVFVDAYRGRLINLHPSLLPAFPGAHAVRDALHAGVKLTGTTIHLVDYEVDRGEILHQASVPILGGDDEQRLHERINSVEHRALPQVCRSLLTRTPVAGSRP